MLGSRVGLDLLGDFFIVWRVVRGVHVGPARSSFGPRLPNIFCKGTKLDLVVTIQKCGVNLLWKRLI